LAGQVVSGIPVHGAAADGELVSAVSALEISEKRSIDATKLGIRSVGHKGPSSGSATVATEQSPFGERVHAMIGTSLGRCRRLLEPVQQESFRVDDWAGRRRRRLSRRWCGGVIIGVEHPHGDDNGCGED
jgi:hypothetical protein